MQIAGLNFSPHGRMSRKAYRIRFFISFGLALANVVLVVVAAQLALPQLPEALQVAWSAGSIGWALIGLWPAFVVLILRLHDIGATGWWALLGVVPLVSLGLVLVLLFRAGQPGANRFGPAPA